MAVVEADIDRVEVHDLEGTLREFLHRVVGEGGEEPLRLVVVAVAGSFVLAAAVLAPQEQPSGSQDPGDGVQGCGKILDRDVQEAIHRERRVEALAELQAEHIMQLGSQALSPAVGDHCARRIRADHLEPGVVEELAVHARARTDLHERPTALSPQTRKEATILLQLPGAERLSRPLLDLAVVRRTVDPKSLRIVDHPQSLDQHNRTRPPTTEPGAPRYQVIFPVDIRGAERTHLRGSGTCRWIGRTVEADDVAVRVVHLGVAVAPECIHRRQVPVEAGGCETLEQVVDCLSRLELELQRHGRVPLGYEVPAIWRSGG